MGRKNTIRWAERFLILKMNFFEHEKINGMTIRKPGVRCYWHQSTHTYKNKKRRRKRVALPGTFTTNRSVKRGPRRGRKTFHPREKASAKEKIVD